jgi:hypothetical protein
MAKTPSSPKKKPSEALKKTSVKKKPATSVVGVDTANEQALATLEKLNIEVSLRSDIQWCLGSYRHDQNPAGLIETAGRALDVLKTAKAKNAKAVAAKVISDLQKVLK